MANEKTKLKETKGVFKVIGKVARIDRDGAFREDVLNKPDNRNHGRLYRSLRFGVKTSPTNEIIVQAFDYEPQEVFLWNSKKREADPNYKGDRIPFETWKEQQDELREQGYVVLQSRIGLDYDEKGKLKTKGLPRFVALKEIYENINNGDSVVVEGTIRYSKYKNRNDEIVEQKNYMIERVFRIKDIDFEDDNFEEVSYFEQEMVFVDADLDKGEKKAYVTGRIIDFNGNFEDTQFVINFANENGETDPAMLKLAQAFTKKMEFGDVINVFGDAINRVVVEEVEDEEEDDLLAELGGRSKPKHAQNYVSRTYITEMSINGVDAWKKGVYTEDDFEKDSLIDGDDGLGDLGGKKKPNTKNPFETDEDVDIDEDSLPF